MIHFLHIHIYMIHFLHIYCVCSPAPLGSAIYIAHHKQNVRLSKFYYILHTIKMCDYQYFIIRILLAAPFVQAAEK